MAYRPAGTLLSKPSDRKPMRNGHLQQNQASSGLHGNRALGDHLAFSRLAGQQGRKAIWKSPNFLGSCASTLNKMCELSQVAKTHSFAATGSSKEFALLNLKLYGIR